MSGWLRAAAAAGYGIASFLSFPQAVGGGALDLGLAFAPLGPLLLLLAIRRLPPRRAFGFGLLASLVAHTAILHWIYVVTVVYGRGAPIVGVLAVLALALFVASFGALFCAVAAWLEGRRLDAPITLACLWTAVDHLRSFAFTGFPWATLGYAWHANRPLVSLTEWTGVYGLSFAAALAGAGLADLLRGRSRRGAATLVAVAALHGAGLALAAEERPEGAGQLRVAVLQGNIEQGVKWTPEWRDRTWDIYESLTRAAVSRGAEVVVWPETAAPGSPDVDLELRDRLSGLARQSGATLVVGAVGVEGFDPLLKVAGDDLRYFDSAFVIAPDGGFQDRYDKTHLVPFGEYVPGFLRRVVSAVATGIASGDVTEGRAPRAISLRLPVDAEAGARVSVGVPICYELIFPDVVRRFGGNEPGRNEPGSDAAAGDDDGGGGARVLLGITNDAWYGRTGAPYQFLVMTALRAAETRTWLARAANTGVSAFIDDRGRVQERTRIFERDFLVRDLPLRPPKEEPTFYVRHGDVFALSCWLVLAIALLRGLGRTLLDRPRGSR